MFKHPVCGHHRSDKAHGDHCSRMAKKLHEEGKLVNEIEPKRIIPPAAFKWSNGHKVAL